MRPLQCVPVPHPHAHAHGPAADRSPRPALHPQGQVQQDAARLVQRDRVPLQVALGWGHPGEGRPTFAGLAVGCQPVAGMALAVGEAPKCPAQVHAAAVPVRTRVSA